ncbi:MAG: LppA family lipoprotein [Mycobacterium sp.]
MLQRTVTLAVVLGVTLGAAGCLDARDVDPAARPDESELNRLQEIVNARPDMETVQAHLRDIQARVQQAITRVAPAVMLPATPRDDPAQPPPGRLEKCVDPFTHSIGRRYRSGEFVSIGGGFTDAQWQQLVAELTVTFEAAGFIYDSARYAPPAPDHRNASQFREDGVRIELLGSLRPDGPVVFGYEIECNLPGAWRTSTPPEELRLNLGPGSHYPYLYGDGRTDA